MNLGEILRTVFVEIRGHKMRSVLTLLGIILGTFAITVMTSFLDGIVASVWRGFSDLGFDGVMYVVDREPEGSSRARRGCSPRTPPCCSRTASWSGTSRPRSTTRP